MRAVGAPKRIVASAPVAVPRLFEAKAWKWYGMFHDKPEMASLKFNGAAPLPTLVADVRLP